MYIFIEKEDSEVMSVYGLRTFFPSTIWDAHLKTPS